MSRHEKHVWHQTWHDVSCLAVKCLDWIYVSHYSKNIPELWSLNFFHTSICHGARSMWQHNTLAMGASVSVCEALTCSVVRSVSSALGSSDEEEDDLRCSWNLLTGIQRKPSSGAHALTSFISTKTTLPCLSLMGSKYTCPRSTVPRRACTTNKPKKENVTSRCVTSVNISQP